MDAKKIQIGQVLNIPDKSGTNPNNMFMYTVQKGDTLYGISKKYNVPVDTIIKDNSLTSSKLSIGQILKIRTEDNLECYGMDYAPPTSDKTYIVKKGDSLYQIAKMFNTSVDNIKKKNNLTTNTLSIGQKLLI